MSFTFPLVEAMRIKGRRQPNNSNSESQPRGHLGYIWIRVWDIFFFCFWRLKMNRTRKIKTKHLDPIGLWQVFLTGLCRILGWYPKECLINHHIPVFHIGIIFKRPLFGGVPLLVPSFSSLLSLSPIIGSYLIPIFFLREGPRIGLRINVQVSPPWFLAIFPQPNPVKVCVYNSI